jgi:hypothetical protein
MRHQTLTIIQAGCLLLKECSAIEELGIEEVEVKDTKFTVQVLSDITAKPYWFAIEDHLHCCCLERFDGEIEIGNLFATCDIAKKTNGVVCWDLLAALRAVDEAGFVM